MKPGWACDNDAGIYFEDNVAKRAVTSRVGAKVYYVSAANGKAVEKVYEPGKI
jgi:dipeptidase E